MGAILPLAVGTLGRRQRLGLDGIGAENFWMRMKMMERKSEAAPGSEL